MTKKLTVTTWIPAAALAAALFGCGGQQPQATSPGGGYGGGPAAAPTAPQVVYGPQIDAGTQMTVRLDQPIGTDVSKQGDRFTATVMTPLVDPNNRVLIPAGSQVQGHVAELRTEQGDQPAAVSLAFDSIALGGGQVPFSARIMQAHVEGTGAGVRSRDVLIGTGGGAALGAILGGSSGAVKGALVGAGAGTLLSLGTAEHGARLEQGTPMTIALDRAIPIASLPR